MMSDHVPLRPLGAGLGPLRKALLDADAADYWPGEQAPQDVRVVLIKPTDRLLIGNVTRIMDHEDLEAVADALRRLGFERPVMIFEGDITIGVAHGQNVEA